MRLGLLGGTLALASVLAGSGSSHAVDGWLTDARNGCKLWIMNVKPGQAIRWDGACSGGAASGRGKFTILQDGQWITQGEAEFQNGRRNGRGFVVTSEGIRQEGEYVNGVLDGRVVMSWPDGDRYDGQFRNGGRNGRGVFTSTNGERYDGEWRSDKREGKGVQIFADGGRYEGEWKDDKPDGSGVYKGKGDAGRFGTWSGVWRQGCLSVDGSHATLNTSRKACGFGDDD